VRKASGFLAAALLAVGCSNGDPESWLRLYAEHAFVGPLEGSAPDDAFRCSPDSLFCPRVAESLRGTDRHYIYRVEGEAVVSPGAFESSKTTVRSFVGDAGTAIIVPFTPEGLREWRTTVRKLHSQARARREDMDVAIVLDSEIIGGLRIPDVRVIPDYLLDDAIAFGTEHNQDAMARRIREHD
jgi:hypothetical protein